MEVREFLLCSDRKFSSPVAWDDMENRKKIPHKLHDLSKEFSRKNAESPLVFLLPIVK